MSRNAFLTLAVVASLSITVPQASFAEDGGAASTASATNAGAPVLIDPPPSSPAGSGSALATPTPTPTATPAPPTEIDPGSSAKDLYRGITTKNWFLIAGAALSLLIFGARWLLARKWKSWEKDRWGWFLAAAMSGLTAIATAWSADAPIASEQTLIGAVKLFAAAVFAYVTSKKLFAPADSPATP